MNKTNPVHPVIVSSVWLERSIRSFKILWASKYVSANSRAARTRFRERKRAAGLRLVDVDESVSEDHVVENSRTKKLDPTSVEGKIKPCSTR
jgi:hypothetical protein